MKHLSNFGEISKSVIKWRRPTKKIKLILDTPEGKRITYTYHLRGGIGLIQNKIIGRELTRPESVLLKKYKQNTSRLKNRGKTIVNNNEFWHPDIAAIIEKQLKEEIKQKKQLKEKQELEERNKLHSESVDYLLKENDPKYVPFNGMTRREMIEKIRERIIRERIEKESEK
ncbi:Uncharacterised protein [uncultured archaeon]|nr:Uncharacterised protein [uncultured archaeon]